MEKNAWANVGDLPGPSTGGDYAWDAQETLNQIKRFHSTGIMLARHLLTAFEEGKQIEYLKAYVEIFDSLPQGPET